MNALCRHFGTCGGCAFQDLSRDTYRELKRAEVTNALARHGIEAPVALAAEVAPGTRRRATWKAVKKQGAVLLGFSARRSHDIVDLGECLVLTPTLVALVPALREQLQRLLEEGDQADVSVTETDSGIDMVLNLRAKETARQAVVLAQWADRHHVARISVNGGVVVQLATPGTRFGRADVFLPPDAFLQPSREGERVLQTAVLEFLSGARRVADLFAGCGTFTLPLAERASVHTVDVDAQALEALGIAARRTKGLKPVTTEARDLFKRPLRPDELNLFEAVVLDPPRGGAHAQVEMVAASCVGRIAYVSCNPGSFARDAAILMRVGFRLKEVKPVDQFLWSKHIELAGRFERGASMVTTAEKLTYAAAQVARVAFYGVHYLVARLVARDAFADIDAERHSFPSLAATLKGMRLLFEKDMANAEAGLYPLPLDIAQEMRRARASLGYLVHIPRVAARRRRNGHSELKAPVENLPRYYQQNFHYQTDGYLSANSARLYDFQVEALFSGTADAMRRRAWVPIARFLEKRDAKRAVLLDIGAGTGAFLAFVKRVSPELKVAALDLSKPYLERAEKRLSAWRDVKFLAAPAEKMPVADRSVDASISIYLFHELPPQVRTKVAREIGRVLKPGGIFVLAETIQYGDLPDCDGLIETFPDLLHEPYYESFARQDLAALFAPVGLTLVETDIAYLTKISVFRKEKKQIARRRTRGS